MEQVRSQFEQLRARWQALSLKVRLGIIAGAAVVLTAIVIASTMNSSPTMTVLFANLSQDDMARISARLDDMNVVHEIGDGGNSLMVDEEHVHETRLTLSADGIMQGSHIGFELFDAARFGESDRAEQIRYERALQGELEKTISAITGIENARVHIVLTDRSLFTTNEESASASVALQLRPGLQLRDDQVRGIVNLVAASVRGLEAENVTVVDGQGRSLSGVGTEDSSTDAFNYRTRVEEQRAQTIQELLDSTLGAGRSRVQVSAEINFTREMIEQEIVDPERTATTEFTLSEEMDPEQENGPRGVAGAAANLPGNDAAGGSGATNVLSRNENRRFHVSTTKRTAHEPVGRIEKLAIAVLVDGEWTGTGEARTFEPKSEEDLNRIREIVSTAAGINMERGDQIIVQCVPFVESESPPLAEIFDPLADIRPWLPLAGYLVGFLFVVFLGVRFALWRKRRKKELAEEAARYAPPELSVPTSVRELERSMMVQQANREALAAEFERENGEDPTANEIRNLAAKLAAEDPERAARVVRGWLIADADAQSAEEAAKEAA